MRGTGPDLPGVSVHDPSPSLPVAALLCGVGLQAAALPALRAARVDPALTLREE